MKILFDTSVLAELDSDNEDIRKLIDILSHKNAEIVISTVTLAEIYLGAFLQKDSEKILLKMKSMLSTFKWHDIGAQAAEETAKIQSHNILNSMAVEFQDSAIAASFITSHSDYLLTLNIKHFQLPFLKNKIYTPNYFYQAIIDGKIKL